MTQVQPNGLGIELAKLALRYHRKAGAILQSMYFLLTAEDLSSSNAKLMSAIGNFEKYLKPHSLKFQDYFAGLLLFALVSEFEIYLVDGVKAVIRKYPKKVGSTQFKLLEILELPQDELIATAAEDYLNRLMYKKPSEYLSELANVLGIDPAPLLSKWPSFVEAKARRDLGAHNGWLINETYIRKLREVNMTAPTEPGLILIPDHEYISVTINACDVLVDSIHEQLMAKYA